uniref:Uncharacterized protein n=1 Tax=Pyramimonas orientalis virus TaxID=455367 RepID=A0A7M3UP87_POV01|nr:hypothetical protein HWQ62_00427 [Pyramimonas orientalis virus]
MSYVFSRILSSLSFLQNDRKRKEEGDIRKAKLRRMIMEEKKQAEDVIRAVEEANRIMKDL